MHWETQYRKVVEAPSCIRRPDTGYRAEGLVSEDCSVSDSADSARSNVHPINNNTVYFASAFRNTSESVRNFESKIPTTVPLIYLNRFSLITLGVLLHRSAALKIGPCQPSRSRSRERLVERCEKPVFHSSTRFRLYWGSRYKPRKPLCPVSCIGSPDTRWRLYDLPVLGFPMHKDLINCFGHCKLFLVLVGLVRALSVDPVYQRCCSCRSRSFNSVSNTRLNATFVLYSLCSLSPIWHLVQCIFCLALYSIRNKA